MKIETRNTTTAEQVIQLIAQELRLRPETVLTTSDFDQDLGTDSYDKLNLVMAIEDTFRLRMPRDMGNYTTVQELIDITLQAAKNMHPSAIRREAWRSQKR
jgi:acyl carrier protein